MPEAKLVENVVNFTRRLFVVESNGHWLTFCDFYGNSLCNYICPYIYLVRGDHRGAEKTILERRSNLERRGLLYRA